jgi:glycolate oxidase
MQSGLIDALKGIVGAENVLTSTEDLLCYSYDATPGFSHPPDAVVVPGSAAEVAKVMFAGDVVT